MDTDDVKKAAEAKVRAVKSDVVGEARAAEIWEVRGPEGGRRRAGIRFTPEPLRVDTRDLTPKEAVAIAGDPALSVKVIGTVSAVAEAEGAGEVKPPAA